jgi:ATP-dependent DNA helicase RecQ
VHSVKKETQLKDNLQNWFGHSDYRSVQQAVLLKTSDHLSGLALMPTGTGKSLCYQYWARFFQEKAQAASDLVIVVSPLIALMQDQRAKAEELGLRAVEIHSNLSLDERQARMKKLKQGEYSLLFCTPERFSKSEFKDCLKGRQVGLLAVDEAHCISLWGHDFRPDYAQLRQVRELLGRPPVLALTATATPQVQKDICESLKFEGEDFFLESGGIERDNLFLNVHDLFGTEEKLEKLHQVIQLQTGAILIYSTLIDTLYKISKFLNSKKIEHLLYHGDLTPSQRRKNLSEFMRMENPVMVATPAFGLGIDKPNIRQVFNFEIPGSIEDYYQQIGRGGRDGLPSEAHFLFDEEDTHIQMEFVKWSFPDESYIRQIYKMIAGDPERFRQQGFNYLREQISYKNKKDFRVESAVNILERWGCLIKSEDFSYWTPVAEPADQMFLDEKGEQQMKAQNMKLLELLRFAKNTEDCRLVTVYKYFGHKGEDCGRCDVCRSDKI